MTERVHGFYEELADHYHLIFEDWDRSIDRQAAILRPLLAAEFAAHPLRILDCACGIGTQAIGLAAMGHTVVGSDLSGAAIERARKEALRRSVSIEFHVSDMTSLAEVTTGEFDAVVALDNTLPHLSARQLRQAVAAIAAKLRPDELLMASIRDYDTIILKRPAVQEPGFYGTEGNRRIVHQVWDWTSGDRYVLHLYITAEGGEGWETHHFVAEYRCLMRDELERVLRECGFTGVRWLMPEESGFYQPMVLARLGKGGRGKTHAL